MGRMRKGADTGMDRGRRWVPADDAPADELPTGWTSRSSLSPGRRCPYDACALPRRWPGRRRPDQANNVLTFYSIFYSIFYYLLALEP